MQISLTITHGLCHAKFIKTRVWYVKIINWRLLLAVYLIYVVVHKAWHHIIMNFLVINGPQFFITYNHMIYIYHAKNSIFFFFVLICSTTYHMLEVKNNNDIILNINSLILLISYNGTIQQSHKMIIKLIVILP